ncbi:MAG TPA: hypothetical protein VK689_08370 [Armatimonadota bacterium]|nr:hypothetical protein [Armatimonadota bacterium]
MMQTLTVQLIDSYRIVVATAQVAERGECLAGLINLGPMPAALRHKFAEYEEIVDGQMFSLLDDIEEQINAVPLTAVFGDGSEAPVEDLQIYPSTGRVSFRLAKERVEIKSRPVPLRPVAAANEGGTR